ncbi:MAG: septum formation initiator family protein [Lachnospiraceae bacterium]|nr:septum formation initiator family protein [Lachnospiraceae bacterium]
MGQSRNERMKRKSKYSWGSRMALIGITMVVLSLAVVMNFGAASLREKDLEYQAKEQNLEKVLAEEEARAAQLEEYRVYVQTKQYVEKVAKEKLGLVKEDEILLKPRESE